MRSLFLVVPSTVTWVPPACASPACASVPAIGVIVGVVVSWLITAFLVTHLIALDETEHHCNSQQCNKIFSHKLL